MTGQSVWWELAQREKKNSNVSVLHGNSAQLEAFQEIRQGFIIWNGLSCRLRAIWRQINHHDCFLSLFLLQFCQHFSTTCSWMQLFGFHTEHQIYFCIALCNKCCIYNNWEPGKFWIIREHEIEMSQSHMNPRISFLRRGNEIQYHPWKGHPRFIAMAISWVRFFC